MQDDFALFFAVIVLTLGAVLLHDGVSHPDASQSARIIGGAAFLSLGSNTMLIVLRNWWKWKKVLSKYRDQ
jgi:hypothetical protein